MAAKASSLIYKICDGQEWRLAVERGIYEGSADDRRDGFIHFSTVEQLPATFDRFFRGRQNLVLAAFETLPLAPRLKWEAARNGALFPHLYGPLQPKDASWVREVSPSGEGLALADRA